MFPKTVYCTEHTEAKLHFWSINSIIFENHTPHVTLNFYAKITLIFFLILGQKDVFCPSVLLNKSLRYIFMLEKLGEQKQKPQIKRLPHAPQYSLLLWSRPNAIHLRND